MITQDESNLLHLGFGFRLSDAKEGFTTASEPEINMSPAFVDTGESRTADDIDTFNYELSWRKGPMWIAGEYTSTKIYGAPGGDYEFSGFNIAASWILTGEMRAYNHKSGNFAFVPISKPTNRGGWGSWEIGVRYSHIDLSDKDIFGGEMDVYSLALNWWLTTDLNVNVNWRYVELDRPAELGGPVLHGQSSAIVSRVVLILQ